MSKSGELQEQINRLDYQIQNGVNEDGSRASDAQLNLMEMTRTDKKKELDAALVDEAQLQETLQAQEAEIDSITLPYDFNEILSEGEFKVTTANDMIIEVVKDTKRQANIEKNQALDDLKATYTEKSIERENALQAKIDSQQSKIDSQQSIIENGTTAMEQLTREIGSLRENQQQVNLERDDAFAKRDAAFRQLQKAQDEISALKIKLENAPQAKQTLDVSPSDKLAKMVKESLDEKVKRGLARYAEFIPTIAPVNDVQEEVEAKQEETFQESDQVAANTAGENTAGEGNTAVHEGVDEAPAENEIDKLPVSKAEFEARVTNVEKGMERLMRQVFGEVAA